MQAELINLQRQRHHLRLRDPQPVRSLRHGGPGRRRGPRTHSADWRAARSPGFPTIASSPSWSSANKHHLWPGRRTPRRPRRRRDRTRHACATDGLRSRSGERVTSSGAGVFIAAGPDGGFAEDGKRIVSGHVSRETVPRLLGRPSCRRRHAAADRSSCPAQLDRLGVRQGASVSLSWEPSGAGPSGHETITRRTKEFR